MRLTWITLLALGAASLACDPSPTAVDPEEAPTAPASAPTPTPKATTPEIKAATPETKAATPETKAATPETAPAVTPAGLSEDVRRTPEYDEHCKDKIAYAGSGLGDFPESMGCEAGIRAHYSSRDAKTGEVRDREAHIFCCAK